MNDDYLWDRSGDPDPEIQNLEKALGRFAHQGPVPDFAQVIVAEKPGFWQRFAFLPLRTALAVAGTIFLVITAFALLRWSISSNSAKQPGWDVAAVAGSPRVETNLIVRNVRDGKLHVGQTLVTDDKSKATVSVNDVGTVDVEPNSRLRLLAKSDGRNRMQLDRGTIRAFIWAQPGQFAVDTPSAIAVDLGCQYTLTVDDSGAGLLRTTLGWVGFKLDDREAFIPAGAVCATRPHIGPGTPYFEDAPASFSEALSRFDFSAKTDPEKNAELDRILSDARERDALTLWHLLARVNEQQRQRVYDRLATLAPPPPGVTRESVLRLDQTMLDAWWNQLGLGNVSLWRTWERAWSQNKS